MAAPPKLTWRNVPGREAIGATTSAPSPSATPARAPGRGRGPRARLGKIDIWRRLLEMTTVQQTRAEALSRCTSAAATAARPPLQGSYRLLSSVPRDGKKIRRALRAGEGSRVMARRRTAGRRSEARQGRGARYVRAGRDALLSGVEGRHDRKPLGHPYKPSTRSALRARRWIDASAQDRTRRLADVGRERDRAAHLPRGARRHGAVLDPRRSRPATGHHPRGDQRRQRGVVSTPWRDAAPARLRAT